MADGIIVELPTGIADRPVARRRPTKRTRPIGHRHEAFEVDIQEREVFCRECGKQMDPFDAILGIMYGWERWESRIAEHKKEKARRDAANQKARERRAKRKAEEREG